MPVPWWVEVLENAKEWGLPPWELCWDKGKVLWVLRNRIIKSTQAQAMEDKRKHNK